jgi:hypothetical protein
MNWLHVTNIPFFEIKLKAQLYERIKAHKAKHATSLFD